MIDQLLPPLIVSEIAGIAAIEAAIAREPQPDYVVMFQSAKNSKQANVEQMATLMRMRGEIPQEEGGFRKYVLKAQSALAERVAGTTATLRAMRMLEAELVTQYADAVAGTGGIARQALRTSLGRALVRAHLLTAHIAKRTGSRREAATLPRPLDEYFAGPRAKACMRCHLDRPGPRPALERGDPHPYTYVCAGCHADVRREFPADLAAQIDGWPRTMQDARVLQHAIGRVSALNAIRAVLHPLSGLAVELPVPAGSKATNLPALAPPPSPGADETARTGVLTIQPRTAAEAAYVSALFDYRSVRSSW